MRSWEAQAQCLFRIEINNVIRLLEFFVSRSYLNPSYSAAGKPGLIQSDNSA